MVAGRIVAPASYGQPGSIPGRTTYKERLNNDAQRMVKRKNAKYDI